MKSLSPSLSKPMEFKSPEGVSATRGGGLPSFFSKVIVLVTMAPRTFILISSLISLPNPHVPDARITGFFSSSVPILVFKFFLLTPI